jgi:hypothetical protein
LALLLVFGGSGWVGYQSFTAGFTAKPDPDAWEVVIARKIRRLAIPSEIRKMPNPVPMSPAVLKESLAHFADHCAICHANDGSGQTPIGKSVYPKTPDLRLEDTQSMSDGELFFTIHNGIRFTAMPAWGEGDMDKDTGSWKLVHFIRHLPRLTPHELDDMKALNPRAPHDPKGHADDAEPGSGHHH